MTELPLDNWAARLAELRSQRGASCAGLDLLVEHAVAAAGVTRAELACLLGVRSTRGLGSRRTRDACEKVGATLAVERFVKYVVRGSRDRALGVLADKLSARFGRPVTRVSLRRWVCRVRKDGPAGLLDFRGRPPGRRPVDEALLVEFCSLLGRGASVKAAHGAIADRASREKRVWPRSLHTIRAMLRSGATIERPLPKRGPGNRGYLLKGMERN